MEELIAFHGDPKVKAFYLRRVHNHRKADEIIHGKYWENGRGCGVGCTIHSDDHNAYETELGIPVQIAYLEDAIFEGMANGKSKEFPERFLKAIKPGVDLSLVVPRLVVWQGLDPKHGVINLVKSNEERECVKLVAGLYQRIIDGGTVTYQEWVDAENQAGAGAWVWARAGARAGAWVWARAGARVWVEARAGAGARVWVEARAGAWAGARAGARVWAWAGARVWVEARAGAGARVWVEARAGAGARVWVEARAGAWAGAWAGARVWVEARAGAGARVWVEAWAGARAGARAGAGARVWVEAWAGARAGARARVWAGARAQPKGQKQWEILADKFIELLKSAPV